MTMRTLLQSPLTRVAGFLALLLLMSLSRPPALCAKPDGGALGVRRAIAPDVAAALARRGTPWRGPLLSAEQARIQELKLRRARAIPQLLTVPGVDWSPRADRRVGWHPPATAIPNPSVRHAANAAIGAPSTPPDTLRVAMLRIDFLEDRGGDQSTGDGRFDLSGPDSTAVPVDPPPHNRAFYASHLEALSRYMNAESYGRSIVVGDVWPRDQNTAYHCSDLADFGPWKFSPDIYGAAVHMFRTMLFAADSQSMALGDRIPWDQYDRIIIVHAGSDFQNDVRQDSPLDIPTFTIGVLDTDVVIFPDSTNRPIDRASIVPETINQDGYYGAINGALAHEGGIGFYGWNDTYNVDTAYPVVGLWDIMDSGNLAGSLIQLRDGSSLYAVGLLPPSVDPFQRIFCTDALQFRDVSWGDTMAIANSERNPDIRRVWQSSDEYLLLENRHLAPSDTVQLATDSTTHVVLGPKVPDAYEYDALLPGSGMLVWHIDASVIPFATSFRYNSDGSFNTDPARNGLEIIEADKLADIGDPGSPYILGAPFDPYFVSNNPALSDTTVPNLLPHIRTHPHVRLDFLDDPALTMHVKASQAWTLPGWPVQAEFPPEGPMLLAVDADGDGKQEICWAGGGDGNPDSTALFAVRSDGTGLGGGPLAFAQLDVRPRQPLAAIATGAATVVGSPPIGPALFAVSTCSYGSGPGAAGGRVWLIDATGLPVAGWPASLPSIVSTPPVIVGTYPNAFVFVGCADGAVYELRLDGSIVWKSSDALPLLAGGVGGRLAVATLPGGVHLLAFGGSAGDVAVLSDTATVVSVASTWPKRIGGGGFTPDFLWIDFDGNGHPAGGVPVCGGTPTLVVHSENRLWAFCAAGQSLPGWGQQGDTLIAGLGAADVDGDGYAEVLAQSRRAGMGYWNQTGAPSPGWPKPTTREGFVADAPVIAADVSGGGLPDLISIDGSGHLNAVDGNGRVPDGWPLATGMGARGGAVVADLLRNGALELVAPDRMVPDSLNGGINGRFGTLYAYELPARARAGAVPWPMLGGDAGRSSALTGASAPKASASPGGPYVDGSLMAYPNPTRNRQVKLAYRLTEPARVNVDVMDSSGYRIASWSRDGRQADNLDVWDPAGVPAGLYLVHVRIHGTSGDHDETIQVGVIK